MKLTAFWRISAEPYIEASLNKLFKNKQEYLEIKNNICDDISKISILGNLDIENKKSYYDQEGESNISDISSSNSDDEFIIIEDA